MSDNKQPIPVDFMQPVNIDRMVEKLDEYYSTAEIDPVTRNIVNGPPRWELWRDRQPRTQWYVRDTRDSGWYVRDTRDGGTMHGPAAPTIQEALKGAYLKISHDRFAMSAPMRLKEPETRDMPVELTPADIYDADNDGQDPWTTVKDVLEVVRSARYRYYQVDKRWNADRIRDAWRSGNVVEIPDGYEVVSTKEGTYVRRKAVGPDSAATSSG